MDISIAPQEPVISEEILQEAQKIQKRRERKEREYQQMIAWRKAEDEKNIKRLIQFALSYIGKFLNDEQIETLKYNIRTLATEENISTEQNSQRPFTPICFGKLGLLNTHDIWHLCHAMGSHTTKKIDGLVIACFVYDCFPGYSGNYTITTIGKRLTEKGHKFIPVFFERDLLIDHKEPDTDLPKVEFTT